MMALSDADLDAVAARVEQRRNARSPDLPLTGWQLDVSRRQEAARLERVRLAKADEERAAAERAKEESHRQAMWEANAPVREAARAELAELQPALAVAREAVQNIEARERELRGVISKWRPQQH